MKINQEAINRASLCRMQSLDELWMEEDNEVAEHPYYNNFPNKTHPTGGLVDERVKVKIPPISDPAQVSKAVPMKVT